MDPLNVDPEKLRIFSATLKDFASSVDNNLDRLQARVRQLGNSWRDQEFVQFKDELARTQRHLLAFKSEAEKSAVALLRDADELSDFQRFRTPMS